MAENRSSDFISEDREGFSLEVTSMLDQRDEKQ